MNTVKLITKLHKQLCFAKYICKLLCFSIHGDATKLIFR